MVLWHIFIYFIWCYMAHYNTPPLSITFAGLGRVRDLKISAERNEIALTWSPPHAPSGLSLNYTVTYISSADNSRTTTTTTNNQSWRIRAKLGDVYTVTVTPNVKFCSGESLAVTVGLDCELVCTIMSKNECCSTYSGASIIRKPTGQNKVSLF